MGLRGELFSTRVHLANRTYFFNVKENRSGDLYLNVVESKNRETGGFERQSVIVFAEDLQEFLGGFDEALRVLEKELREKRRGGSNRPEYREDSRRREDSKYREDSPRREDSRYREDSRRRGESKYPQEYPSGSREEETRYPPNRGERKPRWEE